MWCWDKTLSYKKIKWECWPNSTILKGSIQNEKHTECLSQNKLPSFSLKDILLITWIYFSQLWALSERSVKAAALYTINSQTVTQITCHPYQSLHIELLYLSPAGSPLRLGNITMNLFSVSAQNLTPKEGLLSPLCLKHMELHHTIYSIESLSRFCAHCTTEGQSAISRELS